MPSGVENRRSNCSLPVVSRMGFRLVTSVRFGLVLFPVPAHRTGLAVFPHPALGKDSRFRPRMLRRLIKDITVEKLVAQPKQLFVHIRWQGGASTDRSVPLPPNIADRLRYPATVVERVRDWLTA